MDGRVLQVNVSPGGVPKLPVEAARVGRDGLEGDAHHHDAVHGGPLRAVCLFASEGHDLRPLVRGDADDAQIASALGHIWQGRSDRYSELRASRVPDTDAGAARRVEMSYIGG